MLTTCKYLSAYYVYTPLYVTVAAHGVTHSRVQGLGHS